MSSETGCPSSCAAPKWTSLLNTILTIHVWKLHRDKSCRGYSWCSSKDWILLVFSGGFCTEPNDLVVMHHSDCHISSSAASWSSSSNLGWRFHFNQRISHTVRVLLVSNNRHTRNKHRSQLNSEELTHRHCKTDRNCCPPLRAGPNATTGTWFLNQLDWMISLGFGRSLGLLLNALNKISSKPGRFDARRAREVVVVVVVVVGGWGCSDCCCSSWGRWAMLQTERHHIVSVKWVNLMKLFEAWYHDHHNSSY